MSAPRGFFLRTRTNPLACLLGLLALLFHPLPAQAQSNLHTELAEVAKGIKQLLDDRKVNDIAIGRFTCPPRLSSSAEPALKQILAGALQQVGITVNPRANLAVEGRYIDVIDKKSGLFAGSLTLKVIDQKNDSTVVTIGPRGIFGDAALASLFGLTVSLPPNSDQEQRSNHLKDGIDKPSHHRQNTLVSDRAGSPYAIEILVRKANDQRAVARAVEDKNGLAFVPIARGEIYLIRVINNADHDVAVTVTIDGINMFAFSDVKDPKTGQSPFSQLVIKAKSFYAIPGWFRDTKKTNEFLVTEYAKSAAAELKSTDQLGTITVCFAAAWPKNGKPPADEPINPSKFARSGGDATGRGKEVNVNYQVVERFFGVTRAAISVRYTR